VSDLESNTPDQRLHAIVGRWETSGYVIGEPNIPVVGTDIYEVLTGGYFVVHHVDVTVGYQPVRAIKVIGEPDPETGGYLARSFDSDGNAELMHLTIDENGVFRFASGARHRPRRARDGYRQGKGPIHAHDRRRSSLDDCALGAIQRRHQLAAVDGHIVQAARLTVKRPAPSGVALSPNQDSRSSLSRAGRGKDGEPRDPANPPPCLADRRDVHAYVPSRNITVDLELLS
jgi:hypothetical protein